MAKKLIGMAVVALAAVALPTIASAAPSLTEPAGTLVSKGALISGKSFNTTLVTSVGTFTCASVTANDEVTDNTGSSIKATKKGGGKAEGCKLGSESVTIDDFTLLSLSSNTPGKGVVSLEFLATVFFNCRFTGTNLPFTYTSGSNSITISGTMTGDGFLCPSTGQFSGSYFLLTSNGTPIILD